MEKSVCKICNKVIEGFSKKHVEWLMMQHMLKHRHDANYKEEVAHPKLNPKEAGSR